MFFKVKKSSLIFSNNKNCPGPTYCHGTSKNQSLNSLTLAMFIKDRHTANVKRKLFGTFYTTGFTIHIPKYEND
jgi:hypothetical protein